MYNNVIPNYNHQQQQFAPSMQQLPYDPINLTGQQIMVQIGYPPFVPAVDCSPAMQQLLPVLVSLLITEIQGRAGQNPLRTFMFNQYSMNGYQNAEFVELVFVAINHAEFLLMNRQVMNQEQALQQACSMLCNLAACGVATFYPAIAQYLNPAQLNEAMQGYQMMKNIMAQNLSMIQARNNPMQMQFQNQQQQRMTGYGAAPQQQQRMYGSPVMVTGRPGMSSQVSGIIQHNQGPTNVMRSNMDEVNMPGADHRTSMELRRYQRQRGASEQVQQTHTTVNNHDVPAPHSRFNKQSTAADILQQPFQKSPNLGFNADAILDQMTTKDPFDQAVQTMHTSQPASRAELMTKHSATGEERKFYSPGELKWQSSSKQPYHPAYDSRIQRLFYTVDSDNNVIAVLQDKNESEISMMSFDQHSIGRIPTRPARFTPTVNRVSESITNLPNVDVQVDIKTSNRFVMDTSETAASITCRIESATSGELNEPNQGIRTNIAVADPLPCENMAMSRYYRSVINEIGNSGNFDDAIRIMKNLTSPEDLYLVNRINAVLTEEVCTVLRVNLMLRIKNGADAIDNFMNDACGLDAFLREKKGDDIANALKEQEAKILSRCLNTLSEEETVSYTQDLTDTIPADEIPPEASADPEELEAYHLRFTAEKAQQEAKPCFAYLTHNITYTYLGAYAYQLSIAMVDNLPCMLTQKGSPMLYAMAVDLFSDELVRGCQFRRHYFVTKDGIRFEVARGYLNKSAYLIALA